MFELKSVSREARDPRKAYRRVPFFADYQKVSELARLAL